MSDTSSATASARTALYDLHIELGAKMVPFAGYDMPLQYPSGILKEHKHARAQAGLFDVSHMGQLRLSGPDAAAALESLVPVDIIDLPANRQRYAVFTNPQGGILDDLMVSNGGDHLFQLFLHFRPVGNVFGCAEQDIDSPVKLLPCASYIARLIQFASRLKPLLRPLHP